MNTIFRMILSGEPLRNLCSMLLHWLNAYVSGYEQVCAHAGKCAKGATRSLAGRSAWFFFTGMLLVSSINAQTEFWPDAMDMPEEEEVAVEDDSVASSLSLTSKTSLYQTFKTQNRLDWQQPFENGVLTQTADYHFNQISSQSSIQFYDFSGMLLYNDVGIEGLSAGIDWAPVFSYTRHRNGILQSNADFGPVVKHTLFSIPYTVRGGIYGYGWSDTLESLKSLSAGALHGNPGIYGAVTIADPNTPVGGLPLYVGVNADGRALGGTNLGLVTASALYCHTLPQTGDSIFVQLGDTITNGKELYIGEYEGKSFYSNTSWRINHSFSGAVGVKMVRRFGVAPRLYYRYFMNSIAYPENVQSLDDLLRTGNEFGVAAETDSLRRLSYSGGMEFSREFEDWLFRNEFDNSMTASPENRNALIVNQSDHYSDMVRTDNSVRLRLPRGWSTRYRLAAIKNAKKYPFVFRDGTDIKVNQNENDRVQIDNEVSIRYERDSLFFIEPYGHIRKLYHYYYREQRSAESRITREYRLGCNFGFTAGPVTVLENLFGDAEVSEMRYAVDLPPYARDIHSSLSGKVTLIEQRLQITGKWIELYHDDGYWYGKEYWPDSSDIDHEFYAIEQKGTQYWLDFALEAMWGEHRSLSIGTVLRDVFQRRWKRTENDYLVSDLDLGYGIEPYCTFDWLAPWCIVAARLKRIINTRDPDRFSPLKNWDFSLSLKMVF